MGFQLVMFFEPREDRICSVIEWEGKSYPVEPPVPLKAGLEYCAQVWDDRAYVSNADEHPLYIKVLEERRLEAGKITRPAR